MNEALSRAADQEKQIRRLRRSCAAMSNHSGHPWDEAAATLDALDQARRERDEARDQLRADRARADEADREHASALHAANERILALQLDVAEKREAGIRRARERDVAQAELARVPDRRALDMLVERWLSLVPVHEAKGREACARELRAALDAAP